MTAVLATRLPEYMVPAMFVSLEALPLNASGKLDRKTLPAPQLSDRSAGYRAPSTHTESVLAGVVAELLGMEQVGVDDSFFALGGDSIMSIQLVARAKAAGIVVTPRMVFEHKTIAALAGAAGTVDDVAVLEELPGGGVGEAPLTPIMHWMIEHGRNYGRFSQATVLELPRDVEVEHLTGAVQAVLDHHDALRARLVTDHEVPAAPGSPRLEIVEPGTVEAAGLLRVVDVDGDFLTVAGAELDAAADRLDPANAILLQAVWFVPYDSDDSGRLLVLVHHLAVDGVSWPVLSGDLITAWGQLAGRQRVTLAPVATSFRRWVHGLVDDARSGARAAEIDLWRRVLDGPDPDLGSRPLDPARDLVDTVADLHVEVPAEITETVLTVLPEKFHGTANDGLLTALALATVVWRAERGIDEPTALITLEGHGREEQVLPGADLSRTVGWFTSQLPVRLDLTGLDATSAFDGHGDLAAAVKAVKEQLLALPDRGVGYGLLRYLNPETAPILAEYRAPQIGFNYLGRRNAPDQRELQNAASTDEPGPAGSGVNLAGARNGDMVVPAVLDINASAVGTVGRSKLVATFSYATGLLGEEDVQRFADLWVAALTALADHARLPDAGGHTPSDFELVEVDQRQLEAWETQYPTLQDVWSLSPLQEGLLYQARLAGDAASPDAGVTDYYQVQLMLTLTGVVDAERMRAAGQALLDRYANLRVAFSNSGGVGAQIVQGDVQLPWRTVDLSGSPTGARESELDALLVADRAEGFDLAAAPLMRFTLVRLAENEFRLIVLNHHVLLDGWSMPLMLRELFTLYATRGDTTHLPRPRQYRDFLVWLSRQDHAEALAAWRDAFDGSTEPTIVLGETGGELGESQELAAHLDQSVTESLVALGREYGFTMNTVVQAAWALTVAALSGRTDVTFGATVSGRPPQIDGVEEMLGLFINTLPVRVRLDPSETIAGLLTRIQDEQAKMLDHHYVGLPEIRAAAGEGTVFDTLAVFESYPTSGAEGGADIDGMTVKAMSGDDAVHYPLALVAEQGSTLSLRLKFLDGVVGVDRAHEVLGIVTRLIEEFVRAPQASVASVDLLDAETRRELVPVRGPEDRGTATLDQLLANAVAVDPEGMALVSGGMDVSYRELDARSGGLARRLLARGAGTGQVIAIAIPRSIESITAIWAVIKTGATFLPIDPSYPPERIEHMLTDSGAVLGLTVGAHRDSLEHGVPWLVVDDSGGISEESSVAPISDEDRPHPIRPASAAYMIYTSGSTGLPKGVVVTHRDMLNTATAAGERFAIAPGDRVAHVISPSFDASVLEFLMAFGSAATMVVVPASIFGGVDLADLLRQQQVTHLFMTPGALASVPPAGLDDLRVVGVGGEACTPDLVARWAPGRTFINAYGPTEASIWVTATGDLRPGDHVDIGGALPGVEALVLDAQLRPVPAGLAGELYLAGPSLAQGYHRQPGLTSERFVANPFGEPGDRMYRTGDVTAWKRGADGWVLDYLGRSDFQVKVRGHRIELGEIESALLAHPDVRFAYVIGTEGPGGATALAAYVMPAEGAELRTDELSRFVGETLPSYMVPAAVVPIQEIPLTGAGKIDRAALPVPEFGGRAEYVAASTDTERVVVEAFEELLDIDHVGVDDDFFELGGQSLIAARLASLLAERTGRRLPLTTLFDGATPRAIAAGLDGVAGDDQDDGFGIVLPLRTGGDLAPLFCVHPFTGLAWSYRELATYLPEQRPLIGIQSPALSGGEMPETIAAAASLYVEHIRRVQPEGPYHLLGWSLGGVIAQEMAVQLQESGAEVASLTLLDSHLQLIEVDEREAAVHMGEILAGIGIEFDIPVDETADGDGVLELLRTLPGLPEGLAGDGLDRVVEGAARAGSMIRAHEPRFFDGRLLFFAARLGRYLRGAAEEDWQAFARQVDVVDTWSSHDNMTSPRAWAQIGPRVADRLADES
ncbi:MULTISPECIES: non-ribosomal peptide synthetase [unclassified Gordonia (in: high G+C Gram-positive bacteria)]|uniref:non-ribosomal peptide synthetase n=1 Tax=unclassified Gordonia (in: high G+C Gram-positive bacteria) TaxID=2657482 RepID=UPI001964BB7F|nr:MULTISPECIES: non-ribosomal peptide synthetase [unclassified Gordonia (in: high G+C Gram-positive bacteria)]MBN0973497.1 amino acid adenylation domain-containing protein [Gordonia sp. BP-119]MBN0982115.1 amino acid adenylation domain-containing protein [Gordonia sp. BP-94]